MIVRSHSSVHSVRPTTGCSFIIVISKLDGVRKFENPETVIDATFRYVTFSMKKELLLFSVLSSHFYFLFLPISYYYISFFLNYLFLSQSISFFLNLSLSFLQYAHRSQPPYFFLLFRNHISFFPIYLFFLFSNIGSLLCALLYLAFTTISVSFLCQSFRKFFLIALLVIIFLANSMFLFVGICEVPTY